MTPPAMTTGRTATASTPAPRRATRPAQAPRRVSRPTQAPRRVSGPARTSHRTAPPPIPARALAWLGSLPDHRWVDRLVRGRAWIPVLGMLLAGLVATQVEVLKLGTSMGRWMERSAALTSHNQSLQSSVAALSDDQRIEHLASQMGMVLPAPTAVTFLTAHPVGGMNAALLGIRIPNRAQFEATLASDQTVAAASVAATAPPASPGTSAGGTTSSTATASSGTASTTTGTPTTVTPAGAPAQSTASAQASPSPQQAATGGSAIQPSTGG